MRSSPALPLLVLALLLAGAIGVAVGQTTPTTTPTENETNMDGVTMVVQLDQNGDARWNVTAQFPLQTENDSRAFEQLATEFENEENDVGFPIELFETVASEAASQTGREMKIANDERSSHLGENVGTLTLSFTWTNFSRVSGNRLMIGDAFATESGTWLPQLTADQTLIVHPPAGYTPQSTSWDVINRSLHVEGPQTFERGEPSITYSGDGTTPTPKGPFNDASLPLILVVVLSAAVAGSYAWVRQQGSDPIDGLQSDQDGIETERAELEAVDGDVDERTGPEASKAEPDDGDEVDIELLSDEERVERMLVQQGGRMKQANIVKETNWSNAKVSQLLSAMADEGRINKLRIGRENLISLPDEELGQFD